MPLPQVGFGPSQHVALRGAVAGAGFDVEEADVAGGGAALERPSSRARTCRESTPYMAIAASAW